MPRILRRTSRVRGPRLLSLCVSLAAIAAAPAVAQEAPAGAPGTPGAEAAPAPPPGLGDPGFRFHGYLRSGFGVDAHGKGQQPFQAPLSGAKYRLGNEAESYLETTFAYGARSEEPDPAYFETKITLAYVAPTSQSSSFTTTFSLREAYALARRVWAAQPTATFWAGARFYDRHDLHINDFYYRDPSGFGGGIEDIAIGERAKLAAAWIGGSQDELESNGLPRDELFRFNKNNLEVRAYDLPAGRARLAAVFTLSHFNGDQVATDTDPIILEDSVGLAGTGIVEWPFDGGRYKLAVQYGSGAAFDFRSTLTRPAGRTFQPGERVALDDLWQFRVVNDFLVEAKGKWQFQGAAIYQELDNGAASGDRVRWVSLGARPVYRLGRFFSLASEVGWDHTVLSEQPGGSVVKVTVAPQITPALRFLSRPSLRAFATWAHWSDSFRGQVAARTDPTAVHGAAFGVQLESWW